MSYENYLESSGDEKNHPNESFNFGINSMNFEIEKDKNINQGGSGSGSNLFGIINENDPINITIKEKEKEKEKNIQNDIIIENNVIKPKNEPINNISQIEKSKNISIEKKIIPQIQSEPNSENEIKKNINININNQTKINPGTIDMVSSMITEVKTGQRSNLTLYEKQNYQNEIQKLKEENKKRKNYSKKIYRYHYI